MAEDRVDIEVGATTSDAEDKLKSLGDTLKASLEESGKFLEGFNTAFVDFGDTLDAVKNKAGDAGELLVTSMDETQNAADKTGESFSFLNVMAVAVGTGLERLAEYVLSHLKEALKEAVVGFMTLGEELAHLQRRIGGTAEDLSVLKIALDSIGMSTQQYEGIVRRVDIVIQNHAEKLDAANIAYKDQLGLLPKMQVVQNIANWMNSFSSATERSGEMIKIFGGRSQMMADLIQLTATRMAEAKEVAEQFGLVLTEKDLKATSEMQAQTRLLGDAFEAIYIIIGQQLAPVVTDLAHKIRDDLAGAVDKLRYVLGGIVGVLGAVYIGFLSIALAIKQVNAAMATNIEMMSIMWTNKFHPKQMWIEAKAAHDRYMDGLLLDMGFLADQVVKYRKLVNDVAFPSAPGKPDEEPRGKTKPEKLGTGAAALLDAEAAAELAITKQKLKEQEELNENYHSREIIDEQEYWTKKIALQQAGLAAEIKALHAQLSVAKQQSADAEDKDAKAAGLAKEKALLGQIAVAERQRVDAKVNGERLMMDAVDEQLNKEATATIENAKTIATTELNTKIASINAQHDLGKISNGEMIRMVNEVEEEKLAIERAALVKQVAIWQGMPEKYHEMLKKLALFDAQSAGARSANAEKVAKADLQLQTAMSKLQSEEDQNKGLEEIDAERIKNAQLREMGVITALEEVRRLRDLKEKEYQIQVKYENDLLELANLEPEVKEAIYKKLEDMARKHANDMLKIEGDVAKAQGEEIMKWLQPIADAFATTVNGIIQGTTTIKDGFKNMCQSIILEFNKMTVQLILNWLKTKLQLAMQDSGSSMLGGIFGNMFNNSSMGGSNPFGGAAAAASGGYEMLPDFVPAFATGTNFVPRDMLAIVHRGEAVVPAQYNQGQRGQVAQQVVNNNFTVNGSVDLHTQRQLANMVGQSIQNARIRNG